MMREIEKILEENEKIIWEGKPRFGPFVLGAFVLTPFGAISMPFAASAGVVGVLMMFLGLIVSNWQAFFIGILLAVGFFTFTWPIYRRVHYAMSNKRVIIQTGIIGSDFKTISCNKISNIKVNAGFWDKKFNTGNVLIYAPSGEWKSKYNKKDTVVFPLSFYHISNPYVVFKNFRKLLK
jgi:uncharacterized membrane protein YdbT with pleckstrin-like domain